MGDNNISSNSFRYATQENAQNSDQFYTVKDSKHNIFDKFDTNGDGIIDSAESNKSVTDENGQTISLFKNGYDNLNVDKESSGITQYELAAACSYLDSLDGQKDGVIQDSSSSNFDTGGLKTAYDSIQGWKTGYDTQTKNKLQQTIDMVKNNSDCLSNGNLINELNTLVSNDSIQAEDYYGKKSGKDGSYNLPGSRTDNSIIDINKENLYQESPQLLAGKLVHELTHYDKFENNPGIKSSADDEVDAYCNQFEFIRKLEDKERSNAGTLAEIKGFLQDWGPGVNPNYDDPSYQWYKDLYTSIGPSPNRESDLRRKIADKYKEVTL